MKTTETGVLNDEALDRLVRALRKDRRTPPEGLWVDDDLINPISAITQGYGK